METRNKRDSTRQSSVPSDLHSVSHRHTHAKCKTALSHVIGEVYFAAKNNKSSIIYTCMHTHILE